MPELPEVETVRRGIAPHIRNQTINQVIVRRLQLRWPIPPNLNKTLQQQAILDVSRQAKYLLLHFDNGTLIIHLGMSGRLYLCPPCQPVQKHDHVDIILDNGHCLRFTDPRRFGAILWTNTEPCSHKLLKNLGPEPLSKFFSGKILHQRAQGRTTPIKNFIMDSRIVAGVGNIYAAESLFAAGIHPLRKAGEIPKSACDRLAQAIKKTLKNAIKQGGTTLKDFVNADGKPGYFQQELQVYGRSQHLCLICKTTLEEIRLNQRSTVFCPRCQN